MEESQEAFLHRLRATFQAEAAGQVEAIAAGLPALAGAGDGEAGPAARRILSAVHTLKGAARAVDLDDLELLCHAMERLCAAWCGEGAPPAAAKADLLRQACALIPALVAGPDARTRSQSFALVRKLELLAGPAQGAR